jgi:hypothetical protein
MAKSDKPNTKDRTSLYLSPQTSHGLRYVVFMDKRTQTEIIEEALQQYLERWEKKHGPVPPQKS